MWLVRLLVVVTTLCQALLPAIADAAPSAQTGARRARVIFDFPPGRPARIASSQYLDLVVPFHTTGPITALQFAVWSRGVTIAKMRADEGDVGAFVAASVTVRV